jgi:hypothetical protein
MFFKPTYCCHCGEKIDRTEWPFWTSRRFCEVCEKEFSFHEWFPRVLVLICGLSGLFGAGALLKGAEPVKVVSLKQNAAIERTGNERTGANQVQNSNQQNAVRREPAAETVKPAESKKEAAQKIVVSPSQSERVYFCGAETKKGTPCSRKVKGGGRCWQHQGREAVLDEEKLLITQ